jgi:endogenous inhibitor of DNA gyrase (YacG/DUF329 family)
MNESEFRNHRRFQCPTCRKIGAWLLEESAPFCSERCRLVDLGKWFNEEHSITEPLLNEHGMKRLEELE